MKPIRSISIHPQQQHSLSAKRLLEKTDLSLTQGELPRIDTYREGKRHLHLDVKKGQSFHRCSAFGKDYVCCNVHVLDQISNCPYDCSYCFLQSYLTNQTTQVVTDVEAQLNEIKQKTAQQPWRFFRVGTWDLGDSLALDPLTGTTSKLIEAFSTLPNAVLELRTKSDCVDQLLNLDHHQRTIVSWSLNPADIIEQEEHRTASLTQRLEAMKKVMDAGYLLALHFDPMLVYPGWEKGYDNLIDDIFRFIDPQRISWISIGSLRFNPEMKKTMSRNFPKSQLTAAEMITGPDGKMRYVKPLRTRMYRHLMERMVPLLGDNPPFVYLCMERADMWDKVLGYHPESANHLDYLMTESLDQRFPNLVHQTPTRSDYCAKDTAREPNG
jgi:spore photoproduct lyase